MWQSLVHLVSLLPDLLWIASWALWAPCSPPQGNFRWSNLVLPYVSNHNVLISRQQWACYASRIAFHNSPHARPSNSLSVVLIVNHGIGSHGLFDGFPSFISSQTVDPPGPSDFIRLIWEPSKPLYLSRGHWRWSVSRNKYQAAAVAGKEDDVIFLRRICLWAEIGCTSQFSQNIGSGFFFLFKASI